MKAHTSGFKNNIKLLGREKDAIITYGAETITSEQINSINLYFKTSLLKSAMKQLDLNLNVAIPENTIINLQVGIKVDGAYEYLNYGSFIVTKCEKEEDSISYAIKCYDKMVYSMKEYTTLQTTLTFPATIRDYLNAISTDLGLTFANASDTFANYDKEMATDLYENLGYTYRDILDELAQVTASVICINDDDELEIRYIKETSSLPSGYQQVEYIESTGTQYIDTGVVGASDFETEARVSFNEVPNDCCLLGCRNINDRFYPLYIYPSKFNLGYYNNYSSTITPIANQIYSMYAKLTNGEQRLDVDGTTIVSRSYTQDINTTKNLYLFCVNYNTPSYHSKAKLYSLKIKINGSLVRNFVPCYRVSDNEIGLYDLVNDVFYTNQGTGTFGKGDIVCDTIDEEYLKSINVTIGEKYGPINSIVLSRSGESDNVYVQDAESVAQNGLCELKIIDNQIMNFNDRSDYLQDILDTLDGLEYYIIDVSSTGVLYYDICDRYNISIDNVDYSCVMLNDEINITQGIEENIISERLETSETDYTKADKTDRRINQAYIIVDKQNNRIDSVVSTVNTLDTRENNNYQTLLEKFGDYALQSNVVSIENSVTQLQTDTYTKTEINTKLTDGSVTKVQTMSGTFDADGMHYAKTNAKTSSTINERGVQVDSTSTQSELLFAGYDEDINQTIVRTENITVRRYLVVGNNSRIEDYGNGGGMFIL